MPRNAGSLWKLESGRKWNPLELPEGILSAEALVFHPSEADFGLLALEL